MSDDGKVTDIYFLTQLTPDEKVSMVNLFFMSLDDDHASAMLVMRIYKAAMMLQQTTVCCQQ